MMTATQGETLKQTAEHDCDGSNLLEMIIMQRQFSGLGSFETPWSDNGATLSFAFPNAVKTTK